MIGSPKTRKNAFDISEIPWQAFAIVGAVIALMIALWFISRPADAEGRLAALEARAKLVTSAQIAKGDLSAYPMGTVCTGDQISSFKDQVSGALTNAGLKTEVLELNDLGPMGDAYPLQAYNLRFTGSGSYETAMLALDVLNRQRPRLFVDALAIRNRVSSVDVEFEARVFCRIKGDRRG